MPGSRITTIQVYSGCSYGKYPQNATWCFLPPDLYPSFPFEICAVPDFPAMRTYFERTFLAVPMSSSNTPNKVERISLKVVGLHIDGLITSVLNSLIVNPFLLIDLTKNGRISFPSLAIAL